MAPPRLALVRTRGGLFLLLAVALAQLGALSCATTLRGSVTCLDCAAGHDLSGVVVAVQCLDLDAEGDGAGRRLRLHAAQTDGRGSFDVAVPEAPASRCAARVLGGTEQLCAPRRLAVARVVAGREAGSYALGSRLAVFTRCGEAPAATMATASARGGDQQRLRPTPAAARSPPRGGRSSPPYGLGIPLIYVFPFFPIIGIP